MSKFEKIAVYVKEPFLRLLSPLASGKCPNGTPEYVVTLYPGNANLFYQVTMGNIRELYHFLKNKVDADLNELIDEIPNSGTYEGLARTLHPKEKNQLKELFYNSVAAEA